MVHAFQFKEVAHLFQGVRFQLDFHAGLFLTQPVDAFLEVFRISIRHQVVVFHHGAVIKAHAVVGASAMEHGRFFQQTVAGSGFAGIQNAGAGVGNGFHILSGERSYSGKTLDEVEGGAFRPKNGAGGTFNKHHHGAGRHGFPVMQVNFHLQGGIHLAENFRRDIDAGKNAFFPGVKIALAVRCSGTKYVEVTSPEPKSSASARLIRVSTLSDTVSAGMKEKRLNIRG